LLKEDKKNIPEECRKEAKVKMTHFYKVIGRLTPEEYTKYNFLINFGVSLESKSILQKAVDYALNYSEFKGYLSKIKL
jgi:hypothetical protein